MYATWTQGREAVVGFWLFWGRLFSWAWRAIWCPGAGFSVSEVLAVRLSCTLSPCGKPAPLPTLFLWEKSFPLEGRTGMPSS